MLSGFLFFVLFFFVFVFVFKFFHIMHYQVWRITGHMLIYMYMVQARLVFFTLAHTSSHSCTHKIFYNIQIYVMYIVYKLSTYSIVLLLIEFGYIKITQIYNYQKSKLSIHDDQTFSNFKILKFWIKILFSIWCLNFKWYINPVKLGNCVLFQTSKYALFCIQY